MAATSDKQIYDLLERCGFKHSLLGYRYAFEIIKACIENPSLKTGIVSTYAKIGKSLNTTGSRFERALRHSIEISELQEMTNKEFIFSAIDNLIYGTKLAMKEKT